MVGVMLNKALKIFFAFICIVILIGFLFLSVRTYIMPEISVTKAAENCMLVKKHYFSGKVKPRKIIEVKADEKMYISDINAKVGQIMEPGIGLITFDMSKQNITVNVKVADLKNRIKASEIEKLNLKKQLDDIKLSVKGAEDIYYRAEEEYKKSLLLYENEAITQGELDDKKLYLDNCKTEYENRLNTLHSETEIYDMNISKLNDEIKALQFELQYEVKGNTDEEYKLLPDEKGIYSLADKIYVDYITDKKILNLGDIVIKYSLYNSNRDMYIEAAMDRDTYDKVFSDKGAVYFWKNDEKKRNSVDVESLKEFSDHTEIVFPLRDELNEKINVSDNLEFLVQAEEKYTTVVDKTAIIPIGSLKEDNYCYLFLVETEDSILGKTQFIKSNKYKILAVGDTAVAIEPSDNQSRSIDRFSVIVNYASSILEDNMRVRVIK